MKKMRISRYRIVSDGEPEVTIMTVHGSKNLLIVQQATSFERGSKDGTAMEILPRKSLRLITTGMDRKYSEFRGLLGGDETATALFETLDALRSANRGLVLRNDDKHRDIEPGVQVAPNLPHEWKAAPPKPNPWIKCWERLAAEAHAQAQSQNEPEMFFDIPSQTKTSRTYTIMGDLRRPETFGCTCLGWSSYAKCKHISAVCAGIGIPVPPTVSLYIPAKLQAIWDEEQQGLLDASARKDGRHDAHFGLSPEPERYTEGYARNQYEQAYDEIAEAR